MIWNKDKFEKEIKALPLLVEKGDVLSAIELQNIRQRMLVSLQEETKVFGFRYSWAERKEKIMRYLVSVLVGLSLFGGTALASNSANPGDLLYPIKRVKEKVQLSVSVSEQSKASLQAKFAEERLHELDDLKSRKNNQISTTATSTIESNNDDEIEVEAKANAQVDVNNAINVLKQVRAKLEARGNTQAAAVIGENIIRLQSGAKNQNLKLEFEAEHQNSRGGDGRGSGENSTTKIKIEDDGRIKVEIKSEKNEKEDGKESDDNSDSSIMDTPPAVPATTTSAATFKTYFLTEVQAANSSSK